MSAPRVVVYWADGCHLCEPAKAIVREVAGRVGATVRDVDITGDPELERRYRAEIPVVEVDGRKAFKYHVDPVVLERRLRRPAGSGEA